MKAVWDLDKAYRETTPTRERVCINGLWRWQPGDRKIDQPPTGNWGYFKVPGSWPGIGDYMQKDSQMVHAHPAWKNQGLAAVTAAWYEREITVPQEWAGRRVSLSTEYLNSYAAVYVDGKRVGEMQFPRGEVDVTAACRPGGKHVLSLLVIAASRRELATLSYDNPTGKASGGIARRGLCGDVYLIGAHGGSSDQRRESRNFGAEGRHHVRCGRAGVVYRWTLCTAGRDRREGKEGDAVYRQAVCGRGLEGWPYRRDGEMEARKALGHAHATKSIRGGRLPAGERRADPRCRAARAVWVPRVLDQGAGLLSQRQPHLPLRPTIGQCPGRGGGSELRGSEGNHVAAEIGGRQLCLHAQLQLRTWDAPQLAEILQAADDVGMLVGLSQPHFSLYNWKSEDAERTNGYAPLAEFYVRVAQNHPSVIFYVTSHNATGYGGDMDPDLMDGITHPHTDGGRRLPTGNCERKGSCVGSIRRGRLHHHSATWGRCTRATFTRTSCRSRK